MGFYVLLVYMALIALQVSRQCEEHVKKAGP